MATKNPMHMHVEVDGEAGLKAPVDTSKRADSVSKAEAKKKQAGQAGR